MVRGEQGQQDFVDKDAGVFLGLRPSEMLTKKFYTSGWWGGKDLCLEAAEEIESRRPAHADRCAC